MDRVSIEDHRSDSHSGPRLTPERRPLTRRPQSSITSDPQPSLLSLYGKQSASDLTAMFGVPEFVQQCGGIPLCEF
ncbi:unnamed protein product [Boreogadus saida]